MSAVGDKMTSSWSDAATAPSYTRLQEIPAQAPTASPSSVVINNTTASPAPGHSVIVVNSEAPSVMYQVSPLVQSFSCHILLACFTFWCCGVLFGLTAFILAVLAQSHSTSLNPADRETAHKLGKWSIVMSLFGMLVGVIVTIVVVCVTVISANECAKRPEGHC